MLCLAPERGRSASTTPSSAREVGEDRITLFRRHGAYGGLTDARCTEIDHVAIAVHDLEARDRVLRATPSAPRSHHREIVESDGVEEALIKVADSYIQLTGRTRPDSPIAKSLEKRGEGLHHVGYRVDDCAAALDAMVAAGATAIDEAPRPGSRGTTVAFVHPKGSFGTLIELVQE